MRETLGCTLHEARGRAPSKCGGHAPSRRSAELPATRPRRLTRVLLQRARLAATPQETSSSCSALSSLVRRLSLAQSSGDRHTLRHPRGAQRANNIGYADCGESSQRPARQRHGVPADETRAAADGAPHSRVAWGKRMARLGGGERRRIGPGSISALARLGKLVEISSVPVVPVYKGPFGPSLTLPY